MLSFMNAYFSLIPNHFRGKAFNSAPIKPLNISLSLSHFLVICSMASERFWPFVYSVWGVFSRGLSGLSDRYSIIMGGKKVP